MSQTIHYPCKGRSVEEALSQETFNRLTANIFSWQQGPGTVGGLCFHACWSWTSCLGRRYQGQIVILYYELLQGVMLLYDRTKNPRWKRLAADIVSNVLFLQCADGGFRHGDGLREPVYDSSLTCPIHQFLPVCALLDYAVWEHADPVLRDLVKPAVDRHWEWSKEKFWQKGNPFQHPLKAGWSAVTNQDMTAIASLSAYAKAYGDRSRYEAYGKPALDIFLSPAYYHEKIGVFERGDGRNFVERTSYHTVVLKMLERIYSDVGDERIPAIIENVSSHFFDAAYQAPDGMTHLAWGAQTDPEDKSDVPGWICEPSVVGEWPKLIGYMEQYLRQNPNAEKQKVLDALKETLCAYIFEDGTIPGALRSAEPIITVSNVNAYSIPFWTWLAEYLGDEVRDPQPVAELCIHRSLGELTWKNRGSMWAIEKAGKREFGGYKPAVLYGMTHGPEEKPACGSYDDLENCDIHEMLEEMPADQ